MEENEIGHRLNTLREEEYLCDVTLIVENERFPCHRVVLASRCCYFYAMFRNFKEKTSTEITLQDLSSNGFEDLLKYIYKNEINVNRDNFKSLLIASDMLGIETLQTSCVKFMDDSNYSPNVLNDIFELFIYADFHNYAKLGKTLKRYICENFSVICDSGSVVHLNYEQLMLFLNSNDLTAEKDETVFNGVLKWIKFDKETRLPYLEELLSLIKVPSLSTPYMIGLLLNEPIIKNDPKHVDMVVKRSVSSLYKTYKKPRIELQQPRFFMFTRKYTHDYYDEFIFVPEIFQKNKLIQNFDNLSFEASYLQSVVLNKNMLFILFVNGENKMEFQKINLENCSECTNLNPPPFSFSYEYTLQTDGSRIYLNNQMCYYKLKENCPESRFFVYDLQLNIWIKIPNLIINNNQIINSCFKMHNNVLYSIGGRTDDQTKRVLTNALAFDIRENNWRRMSSMIKSRYRFGACFNDSNLFVCGGKSPATSFGQINAKGDTMEVFDFSNNKWMSSNSLPEKRHRHSMFCVNDKIYVVGGKSEIVYEDTILDICIDKLRFEDPFVQYAQNQNRADRINLIRKDKEAWNLNNIERFQIMDVVLLDS